MKHQFDYNIGTKSVHLFGVGNINLLDAKKVSIVGTRSPNQYSKMLTELLARKLAQKNFVVVSGGAIGIDILAHKAAGPSQTISVLPSGFDNLYPAINKKLLEDIGHKGLLLSQFENNFKASPWSFVARNEIVVALGDILIVIQADLKSGSMTSVEFALKHNKKIFVPLHRIGESEGTNYLLKNNLAEPIFEIDSFIHLICGASMEESKVEDPFLNFCLQHSQYEDVFGFDSQKLFEYELLGKIKIENQMVKVL